jgi:uncharacterized membrane protein HdeD (DUF308 family)
MNGSIEQLRHNWGWMLAFGLLTVLWGFFAVAYSVFFTAVSVLMIAWLLIIGGVIEAVIAIRHREHGHVVLYVLEAALAIVLGALLLRDPAAGALVITLFMAAYFVVAGVFRIAIALSLRLPNWGWTLFSGLLTLALGVMVWMGWPATALWVLGLFLGINLIFIGWARVMFALALRTVPFQASPHPATP